MWRRAFFVGSLVSAVVFFGFLALYEMARRTWQGELWSGTLGPCLRLGAFGLPEDTATLLLAGDSRIRHGIMPSVLANQTGLRVRNIAEQLNLGGDLATLVATLKTLRPHERQRIKRLVVGISAHGLDDTDIRTMTGVEFNHYALADQIRMFKLSPQIFTQHACTVLWPGQYRSLRKRFAFQAEQSASGIPNSCLQPFALHPRDAKDFGYLPLRPKQQPVRNTPPLPTEPTHQPEIFGIRYAQALRSLKQLDSLGLALMLLLPPLNPSYCASGKPSPCEPDKQLGSRLSTDLPGMRGRIVDFARFPPTPLTAAHFVDASHLDSSGAEILTRALADSLQR